MAKKAMTAAEMVAKQKRPVGNPTVMVPANTFPDAKTKNGQFPQPEFSKSDYMRVWFQDKPNGLKWGEVKNDIKELLSNAGHLFNENSDSQTWTRIGSELGRVEVKKRGEKTSTINKSSKEVSLKMFAELTQNLDPAILEDAIGVINKVGGIASAQALAKKWAELCESIGEEAARKAITVIG